MNAIDLMSAEKSALSGIELLNLANLVELLGRFALNLIVILILVRWVYFSTTRRKDFLFTYILISSIVFLLCFLLENVMLQIGFALGLFAIFGIIRYRTHAIPIKEMTYLFLIIGISVINALANTASISEIIFTNLIIIFITYGLEKKWLLRHESSKSIIYEKINLPFKNNRLKNNRQRENSLWSALPVIPTGITAVSNSRKSKNSKRATP